MPKLRNVSGAPVDLFQPAGGADSIRVEPDAVIDVPGELSAEQPPDAYQVGAGDAARLWPHALWALVDEPVAKAAKSTAVKESS
jgi:hypothetical protein